MQLNREQLRKIILEEVQKLISEDSDWGMGKREKSKTDPGDEDYTWRKNEDSGDEEGRHYKDNEEEDEKHLKALEKDMKYDKKHVKKESRKKVSILRKRKK